MQTSDRTSLRTCGPQRCAQVAANRPTPRCAALGQYRAFAAHSWADFTPSLRTAGDTCRSDAHDHSDRPTRTDLPALGKGGPRCATYTASLRTRGPHLAQRCAQGAPTDRQTDERPTRLPAAAVRSAAPDSGACCAALCDVRRQVRSDAPQDRTANPMRHLDPPTRCINLRHLATPQGLAA
jgi:hypothetical protein